MSAAAFVLAINMCVAAIFATSFVIVAVYARSAKGSRWLAAAYTIGITNTGLEFMLPVQVDARPVSYGIFATFLFALSFCAIGLSRHYHVAPPWRTLGVIVVASLIAGLFMVEMPRSSMVRAVLYQLPYFALQMVGASVILRASRRQALDLVLMAMLVFSGFQFLSKPLLQALIGSGGSPQAYLGSTYAAISQASGAVLLTAIGLLMLLIILRDAMAEMTARSETDTLSGLLNRRGFEDRADRLLATAVRAGVPAIMIAADLDHFKAINDTHGHDAGDKVIRAFAEVLGSIVEPSVVLGRQGGEEFAVFLPGANLATGRLYAEGVRNGFGNLQIEGLEALRATASFGVAQFKPGDSLSDLMRRADAALYEAKKSGRDRVCVAPPVAPLAIRPATQRRSGSRRT